MTDEQQAAVKQIESLIFEARDTLGGLSNDGTSSDKELYACRDLVARIGEEYRALKEGMTAMEQAMLQRKLGRRAMDLRRDANWLPRRPSVDNAIPLATNGQWQATDALKGTKPGEEYTGPGTGPRVESYQAIVSSLRTRVGGSIDAWCGACKMMREHTISAMFNDKPKKVVCETCRAQHNYRTRPARGKKADEDAAARGKPMPNRQVIKAKERARTALQQELVDATDVRPFKRRARYKAGEIIEHDDYGRGKVENVLRGSLLVRFRTGLRPLDNF